MFRLETLRVTTTEGATVSVVMSRVAAALRLPAASVAVALRVSGPWPIAVMSAATSVYCQSPLLSATTLRTLPVPSVSATVAPGSALPVITAACSAALMKSSPATGLIAGAAGALVSTVSVCAGDGALMLPAASVAVTLKL